MQKDIRQLRRSYTGELLDEQHVKDDPLEQFYAWFKEAFETETVEPNAMILATATKTGIPSVRTVLLKGVDQSGFVFYTNYQSRKGLEIDENPQASVLFFWPRLQRQIRISGMVSKTERSVSESYFQERPVESRLSAWASAQSQALSGKAELEKQYLLMEETYRHQEIPCPPFWGGYCLSPDTYEFWQGQANRLHDRVEYIREAETGHWAIRRIAP